MHNENGDMQVGIKSSEKKNDDLQSSLKAMGETCEELEKEIKHLHNEMEVFHKSGNIIQDQCDTAKEELGKKSAQFVIMEKTLLKENGDLQDEVSRLTNKCNTLSTEEEFLNGNVKHLTAKLDRATEKSNALKARVDQQDCAINEKEACLLDAKEEIVLLNDRVDELNNGLKLGSWKVDEKQEELQQAQQEINVLRDCTEQMDKELKDQRKVVARGQLSLLKSKEQVEMRMVCNENLDRELVEKSIERAGKEREIEKLNTKVKEHQTLLMESQDQISVLGCDAKALTEQLQDKSIENEVIEARLLDTFEQHPWGSFILTG